MTPRTPDGEHANICIDCGLCCDGTIFQDVPVDESDRLMMMEAGASFAFGTSSFPQPCWAAASRRCSIYDRRPGACRNVKCLLLRLWQAGEMPYAEARALITSTIELRDRVRPQLEHYVRAEVPEDLSDLYRRVVAKIESAADPEVERRKLDLLLLDLDTLRARLAGHFEVR